MGTPWAVVIWQTYHFFVQEMRREMLRPFARAHRVRSGSEPEIVQ